MATVIINGVTCYRKDFHEPVWGRSYVCHTRPTVVHEMKLAVAKRLPPWKLSGKTFVTDYLLADVAIEVGYDPEDVVNLMSGRAYKWAL